VAATRHGHLCRRDPADQLDKIRDPAALPGWLATTTRRECGRVLRTARRPHAPVYALNAENLPDEQAGPAGQQLIAMLINAPEAAHSEHDGGLLTVADLDRERIHHKPAWAA
jgi:hypothetical protein